MPFRKERSLQTPENVVRQHLEAALDDASIAG